MRILNRTMKEKAKFLSLVFASVVLIVLFAYKADAASSGTCGKHLKWKVSASGTLTISGHGPMQSYIIETDDAENPDRKKRPWEKYKSTIQKIVIKPGVSSIGGMAFSGCSAVKSVSIAKSVRTIEAYAFGGCDSIRKLVIPEGVEKVGHCSFSCENLSVLVLPKSLKEISGTSVYYSGLYDGTVYCRGSKKEMHGVLQQLLNEDFGFRIVYGYKGA